MHINGFALIIGIIFLVAGIFVMYKEIKAKKTCTQKVTAKVIKIIYKTDNGTTTYCPVFEFKFDGKLYTARTGAYSSDCNYKMGHEYAIYCNPDKPNKIYLPDDNTNKFISIGFIIISVLAIVTSFFIKAD